MVTSTIAIEARNKVLLVDDDPVSLELMALLLAHEGHEVVRAEDATMALELLSNHTVEAPDVLLVDLQMPGISGGQLAKQVRALRHRAHRPLLLAMSATQAPAHQLAAFDGFLLKPLSVEDLRRALDPQKQQPKSGIRVVPSKKASSSPAQSDATTLDSAVIHKLLTMMPEQALETVITAAIADLRTSIALLREQTHNPELVRTTAHRMKGGAQMIGATRIARLASGLESGGDEEAATRTVLDELLDASIELEGMLFAGKFKKTRAPHHEPSNRDLTGNT